MRSNDRIFVHVPIIDLVIHPKFITIKLHLGCGPHVIVIIVFFFVKVNNKSIFFTTLQMAAILCMMRMLGSDENENRVSREKIHTSLRRNL